MMKAMTSTIAILLVAFATITGIVLAQVPNAQRSTNAAADLPSQAASFNDHEHPILGRVLFEHVTCVHYTGIGMPANSDGSFGGWVAPNEGEGSMTIYENYIVTEEVAPDGTTFRDIRPYDTLGRIEQRIPAGALRSANAN